MRRWRSYFLLLFFFLLSISSVVLLYDILHRQEPPQRAMPLIDLYEELLSPKNVNITQGMSFVVNVTVNPYPWTEKSLFIPFNLSAERIVHRPGWEPYPIATEFSFSYVPSYVILKPGGNCSLILTVRLFDDAPVGRYRFLIEPGNSELHHVGGLWFDIEVYPK